MKQLLIFVLCISISGFAQDNRPKVGLALSGGGARGLAHVGVLKVLEELRIPIDYIAGTSMGAIVGGLYASGYSAQELEKIVLNLQWGDLFSDRPPRQELSLRSKEEDYKFPLNLEFGWRDGGFVLPSGAVGTSQLELLLHELTESGSITDFNQLPIPFRAIATDLETGQLVVFDQGALHRALRASMSVPGAFSPIEVDGRLIGDGGLVKNLPVDVVRKMGADFIIAVNIGTPLAPRKELSSLIGLTRQMLNILTEQNVREQLALLRDGDVLVTPELGDLSFTDFSRAGDAIAAGEQAARTVDYALKVFGVSSDRHGQWLAKKQRPTSEPMRIDFLEFAGHQRSNPEVLKSGFDTQAGQLLDRKTLHADISRLQARGDFVHTDYRITTDRSARGVLIDVTEKSWRPNYFRLGLTLNTDFRGEGNFNLLGSHTRTWVNSLAAEWRNELQIGRTRRFVSEFYQPLNPSNSWFAAARYEHERRPIDAFADSIRFAQYQSITNRLDLDLGMPLRKWAELRAGLSYTRVRADPAIGLPDFPRFAQREGAYTVSFTYDQLDNSIFPRSGTRAKLRLLAARNNLGSDEQYNQLQLDSLSVFSIGPHTFSLGALVAGFGTGERAPSIDTGEFPQLNLASIGVFTLGGYLQLSGYRNDELRGNFVGLGRLVYYRKIGDLPAFGRGIYVGASLEAGNAWRTRSEARFTDLLYGGSIGLAFDTYLGPLFLAYGRAGGKSDAIYLFLGRP